MPIQVVCRCGNSFRVTDDSAGQYAKCPACGAKLHIPDDRIAKQPDRSERPESRRYQCAECGGRFAASEVVEDRGEFVCHDCLDQGPTTEETGVEVRASFFPLAWTLYFTKPLVEIDGRERQINWNQATFFPLPPGKYEVKVYINFLFGPTGVKWLRIDVRPNRVQRLRYEHMLWWAELHRG
jgi:DNA-directed RNA polymerase subunit RPC12/RpoP